MQAQSAGENKQQKKRKQEGNQQSENKVKNVTSARRNATKIHTHTHTANAHANSYDETEQTFSWFSRHQRADI